MSVSEFYVFALLAKVCTWRFLAESLLAVLYTSCVDHLKHFLRLMRGTFAFKPLASLPHSFSL